MLSNSNINQFRFKDTLIILVYGLELSIAVRLQFVLAELTADYVFDLVETLGFMILVKSIV